ncbi:MAG: methionine--tRNA ligase [Minisyncoccales bacterium]
MKKKIFIGVAWPYVNGELHIGHLAGYLFPADIFARFQRLLKNDLLMVSGSDCHGTPTTLEAEKKGVSPAQIVRLYHQKQKRLFKKIKLSFDLFTKTTTRNHREIVQEFFLRAYEKGFIFKEKTFQYYSEREKRFLPDRYVEGICPFCGFSEARSDQCDQCQRILKPGDLKKPYSKISKERVVLKKTEHYFFDWQKLQLFFERYLKERSCFWRPWIEKEARSWLKKGFKPRAITRDLKWGVKIPFSKLPQDFWLENKEEKRFYVWFEAVIGYLSASIEWAKRNERNWKDFWYSPKALHYYFMGKDNLVFHAFFWPGQLYLFDQNIHLPDFLIINQFLNLEGKKFSKSRHVFIDAGSIVEKFGLDPVKFYLTSILPEKNDTSFSWNDFYFFYHNVLISNYANFIYRTLNLAKGKSGFSPLFLEKKVCREALEIIKKAKDFLKKCYFKNYSQLIIKLSDLGNKYLQEKKPWEEKEEKRKKIILSNALFFILSLMLIGKPFLIETDKKLSSMMGLKINLWPENEKEFLFSLLKKVKIKKVRPLFEKKKREDFFL